MKKSVSLFLFLICSILRTSAFIEEAVKQLELEYADSEDDEVSITKVTQLYQLVIALSWEGKKNHN